MLPNFRRTMDYIDQCYTKIKAGDFTYLRCAGEIRSNDKGLSEFSPHWMDNLPYNKVIKCWDYYSIAKSYASVIESTYPTYWDKGFLNKQFPQLELFHNISVKLPESYPIYRINPAIIAKSDEKLKRTGIYLCMEDRNRIEFMAASEEKDRRFGSVIAVGMDPDTYETLYGNCTWVLIERIADTGGSAETIKVENLKGFGGEVCPRSGHWWSPANQSEKRYFEQGEIFPKLKNSFWGKTIWYLEQTNQQPAL